MADSENNIELLAANETGTHTTVVFRRLLNTGDDLHDLAFEVKNIEILREIT